MTQAT